MRELAGSAFISFEGRFADRCGLKLLPEASTTETSLLKRITTHPVLDLAIMPLREDSIGAILHEVARAGLRRNIIHVQIEQAGRLEFGAYDNFHRNCVCVGPAVSRELMDRLVLEHILRSYYPFHPAEGK